MAGEAKIIALLAQVSPFQASRQQRHEMIPTERLGEGGIREDQPCYCPASAPMGHLN